MKKTGNMKFLAGFAIVSSATAMQIRTHLASPDTAPAHAAAAMSTCGSAHDGVTPASCDTTRRKSRVEQHQPPHGGWQLWV
jgi:hypothetical protein